MESARAIEILERQCAAIDGLRSSRRSQEFTKWQRDTEVAVQKIFGTDSRHSADFSGIRYSLSVFTRGTPDSDFHEAYLRGMDTAKSILSSMIDEIREYDLDSDADSPTKILGTLGQVRWATNTRLRSHRLGLETKHRINQAQANPPTEVGGVIA